MSVATEGAEALAGLRPRAALAQMLFGDQGPAAYAHVERKELW